MHRSPVVLVQYSGEADHFAGVEAALAQRRIPSVRMTQDNPSALVEHRFAPVVVVKDTQSPLAQDALRRARAIGAATVLLMDGVVEYRNTFRNPHVEAGFLRPAPVDVVACAGELDRVHLAAWGNNAVATGLPRVDAAFPTALAPTTPGSPLLVATAKRPCFDDAERERLLAALRSLRDEANSLGVSVLWRLTAGLDLDLEVENDTRPLAEALAAAAAVMTTPSTLLVEAIATGRPTAILHPQPGELWQPSPWTWRDGQGPSTHDSLRAMIESLAAPEQSMLAAQHRDHELLHSTTPSPAQALAGLIAELAANQPVARVAAAIPSVIRMPARRPRSTRPRVVNMVSVEGSPVGGVMSWAQRLAAKFRDDPALGFDVRTLVVATTPDGLADGNFDLDLGERGRTDLCVLDPLADHASRLSTVKQALDRLEPDIILPNFNDVCWMAAMLRRAAGTRTIAVAHTDEPYYRDLASHYPAWDAGVGVSGACTAWLSTLAGERPVRTIPCAPPVAAAPRSVSLDAETPLRIAYFGRMVQVQKRVLDLPVLAAELDRAGVVFELHLVGDGPELAALHAAARETPLSRGKIVIHGRKPIAWVERFLQSVDVSVLLSEFEGASVTMMEAMGAGVVPAVTHVSSGVDDWIADGVSGVVVPPPAEDQSHIRAMAFRLAELASDRRRLAIIGRCAWETARNRAGVDGMARAYAGLFAEVIERPAVSTPPDCGLRPLDLWRWLKPWCDEPTAADEFVESSLRSFGIGNVARSCPSDGCGGVLVDSCGRPAGPSEIEAWRSADLPVGVSPHLRTDVLEDRTRAVVWDVARRLTADKRLHRAPRIAVYGTGKHTRRMPGLFDPQRWQALGGLPIVGFIDDSPPLWSTLFGLPVVTLEHAAARLRPDAILLSSDVFEPQMAARCEGLRQQGVEVIRLYTSMPESARV